MTGAILLNSTNPIAYAKLNKLTIKVDRPQLSPEDIKKFEEGMKQAAAGIE